MYKSLFKLCPEHVDENKPKLNFRCSVSTPFTYSATTPRLYKTCMNTHEINGGRETQVPSVSVAGD